MGEGVDVDVVRTVSNMLYSSQLVRADARSALLYTARAGARSALLDTAGACRCSICSTRHSWCVQMLAMLYSSQLVRAGDRPALLDTAGVDARSALLDTAGACRCSLYSTRQSCCVQVLDLLYSVQLLREDARPVLI